MLEDHNNHANTEFETKIHVEKQALLDMEAELKIHQEYFKKLLKKFPRHQYTEAWTHNLNLINDNLKTNQSWLETNDAAQEVDANQKEK
jgi:hypothetical protein